MQVIYKIAEKQRKSRAGFLQLMDYISRDSFKTFGVGVSDDKDIASKQYLINKDLYDKNRDGKDRFTYHVMASFGADVPVEKVIEIMLNFCEENFYNKGFDSFFAVHTDTDNIHCHVVADNVNFNTGNMIHSVTEKQYESMSQKKKDKAETFVYEKQRELFEDICIRHGLDISYEERYEYMHEQKKKEGRKWLTKEQYRAKKDEKSWTNEIKDKLEEIYKIEDVNEDNIKDIAVKYGLEVTRHNRDKKYITFALLDTEGKRTNQKLKLVQELNKKKRKTQDEVTEDNVKLAVKLNTLETQEKELKKDSSENVFNYDNFFGGKKKEIEKEETREDIYAFFEKEKEKLRIRKEKEAEAKAKEDEEKKSKPVKEDIKTPVNTYIVEDSKPMNFELEKEYKTEKDILDNFYKDQEEKKKEQDSKAKALEEEVKNIEKAEIDKITQADEVLRRLNVEEEERQAESKAKAKQEEEKKKDDDDLMSTLEKVSIAISKKPKIDNRPVIFDRLKDFKEITDELETLEFQRDHRLTYSSMDVEKDFDNAVHLAFYSIIKKLEFNNDKEVNRANEIMENVKNNIDSENIRKNLDLVNQLILDNENEYERLKKNNWKEEETETTKTNDEEKEIAVAEVIESKSSLTNGNEEITDSKSILTESKPIITESKEEITSSKQEEQEEKKEEKQDLESKQVDLDSLIDRIDSYKLVEEYSLFDTLPAFQVVGEDLIYDSSSGEGEIELAKSLIVDVKGEEYWKNMNLKDITKWEETGVFTIAYAYDSMDNFKEFAGYEDYSKSTIKQFLEINTELAEELAEQYMPRDSKKKEQDSKDIEIKKDKDREIDF